MDYTDGPSRILSWIVNTIGQACRCCDITGLQKNVKPESDPKQKQESCKDAKPESHSFIPDLANLNNLTKQHSGKTASQQNSENSNIYDIGTHLAPKLIMPGRKLLKFTGYSFGTKQFDKIANLHQPIWMVTQPFH